MLLQSGGAHQHPPRVSPSSSYSSQTLLGPTVKEVLEIKFKILEAIEISYLMKLPMPVSSKRIDMLLGP